MFKKLFEKNKIAQKQIVQIDWETFERDYQPLVNPNPETQSYENEAGEGRGFETYGIDLERIEAADPRCIWTVVDSVITDKTVIVSGQKFANRIIYLFTQHPWPTDVDIEVLD